MPIIPINTPNLAADIVQMDVFANAIVLSAPITLNTYIKPYWALKPSGDCDALILTDFTNYQELGSVNLDDVVITSKFGTLSECGCEIITDNCPDKSLLPNSITTYDQLNKDGVFCSEITIQYTVGDGSSDNPYIAYSETIKVSYEVNCCEKKFQQLSFNVWGRMSDISCQINCLMKVGRSVKKLKKSYLELSGLLWVYYNSVDACNERDKVFCLFNKI